MSKEEKYVRIIAQIASLVRHESDTIANMANICAVINAEFGFWWTGFYRVGVEQLVLGPFQGPLACTRIPFGKGVCGTAWQRAETVIVPDVELFPGHIACSAISKSEIVVPVKVCGEVRAVLDIDSAELNAFDDIDAKYLKEIAEILSMTFL